MLNFYLCEVARRSFRNAHSTTQLGVIASAELGVIANAELGVIANAELGVRANAELGVIANVHSFVSAFVCPSVRLSVRSFVCFSS